MAEPRNASVAIVGAGDYIGAAIARRFAAGGYLVFCGRRNGGQLTPLINEIEAAGERAHGRSLDARKEDQVAPFMADADAAAPLEVAVFNVGGNVNFPLLDTTERVFRKVWEMACFAGFLSGREAARRMLPRKRGTILLTGATAPHKAPWPRLWWTSAFPAVHIIIATTASIRAGIAVGLSAPML